MPPCASTTDSRLYSGLAVGHANHHPINPLRPFVASLLTLALLATFVLDLPALAESLSASPTKKSADPVLKGLPITELSADEAILHALNRLAYGPRPGDIERVRAMGLVKWIDSQLNPNSINDAAMEARLNDYPTLRLSSAQLIAEYPNPKQPAKQAAAENAKLADSAAAAPVTQTAASPDTPSPMKLNPASAPARGNSLSVDPNAVPRNIADDSKRPARVVEELAMAKMTRAIYSERQLQQVLDDFWFNHFNVFADKGEVRYYLTSYERDVIQPNTLGKFKTLVTETAKSPAMLFYLDNFLSTDPRAAERAAAQRAARQQGRRGPYAGWGGPVYLPPQNANKKKQEGGLNENYGRELMELHTLGVDGGYTQKDVTEVARCFTGWTIEKPRENPKFKFDEKKHDPDPKLVLGKKIKHGDIKDAEQVIGILTRHPSTAKFISTKLARRFVSDTPPPALVQRMAKTFLKSYGDIREVMRTMIYSPEFWSREAYRAKIKTPYELVVSSARALGTDVDTPMPLVQWVGRIGQPLYRCQPPTGYSDKAETWVNTGALLNRLNFSLALAGNRVRGSRSDVTSVLGADSTGDSKASLDRAILIFLGGQAAPTTVETLEKQLADPAIMQARLDDPAKLDLAVVTGLVLGAPEFQRR